MLKTCFKIKCTSSQSSLWIPPKMVDIASCCSGVFCCHFTSLVCFFVSDLTSSHVRWLHLHLYAICTLIYYMNTEKHMFDARCGCKQNTTWLERNQNGQTTSGGVIASHLEVCKCNPYTEMKNTRSNPLSLCVYCHISVSITGKTCQKKKSFFPSTMWKTFFPPHLELKGSYTIVSNEMCSSCL